MRKFILTKTDNSLKRRRFAWDNNIGAIEIEAIAEGYTLTNDTLTFKNIENGIDKYEYITSDPKFMLQERVDENTEELIILHRFEGVDQ